MILRGYLEYLDLGIDPESGQPNILVRSAQEYNSLTLKEQQRAWSIVSVASEISGWTVPCLYKAIYSGKLASKTFKKRAEDRTGLQLVNVPDVRTKADKRATTIARINHVLERALKNAPSWLPLASRVYIAGEVDAYLRRVEQEIFGNIGLLVNNNKETMEKDHEETTNIAGGR
jgi:hypothetical protein